MPNQEFAAAFEAFARMRLEGRSDITYRAYDLLTTERSGLTITGYLRAAGQYVPPTGPAEPLALLQSRFMRWGFAVLSRTEIETLLQEFWAWNRIKRTGTRKWPYRDPEEARKLYDQNEAIKAAKAAPAPDTQSELPPE